MSAHVMERLSAYMDGELAAAERQAIDAISDFRKRAPPRGPGGRAGPRHPRKPRGYFDLPARVRFKRRAATPADAGVAGGGGRPLAVIVPNQSTDRGARADGPKCPALAAGATAPRRPSGARPEEAPAMSPRLLSVGERDEANRSEPSATM
jgi:hypothetical protein